jgi:hypothetical protein
MHVHRTPIDLNISNLYAAEAAKKAAEAKQAAEVRRKLLRASAGIGGESLDFESLIVSQRDGEGSGQGRDSSGQGSFAATSAQSGKPRKAIDEQPAAPLSIWA